MKKLTILAALGLAVCSFLGAPIQAADSSYGCAIYNDQGCNGLRIGSGGTVTLDSGGTIDASAGTLTLGAGQIAGSKLANLGVDSTKLGKASVDSEKILELSVGTGKVRANAIDTSKLLWGVVGPDTAKVVCILGGNSRGFGVCSNSATMFGGCGNCQ